jgi:hypothetical protein
METNLIVHTSYQMGGHSTLYGQDPSFYHSLPNYHEAYTDERGRTAVPAPEVFSLLAAVGSAVLSSTVLAAAIKGWLETRRTKITVKITSSAKEVTFEGPNLKDSVSEIQAVIDAMEHNKANNEELHVLVVAERMDVPKITASEWKSLPC